MTPRDQGPGPEVHEADAQFTFRDGERTIRYGPGVAAAALDPLAASGFEDYALLTTPRALEQVPGLQEAAAEVLTVPAGPVPDAAAAVRESVHGRPLVALGGGRVVDAAKAIGGADDLRVAAVPTTLAGSSFTPFHRMPAGVEAWSLVRPAMVVADPRLMASLPEEALAATAMNALAHAAESLYAPGANPAAERAALRAAQLFATGLAPGRLERHDLALAALLGGYAIGTTGFGVHHALCQTIVRVAGTPHAQTNAVMLPHTLAYMAPRAPEPLRRLAQALGRDRAEEAPAAVQTLAARSGATSLGGLGLDLGSVDAIVAAAAEHPALAAAGAAPTPDEVRGLVVAAL